MFHKAKFFGNLRVLLKDEGIPIGVFEKSMAKVQIGQTSRWERSEGEVNPGIEYFIAAKKATGIGIDTMLEVDFTKANPEELYLVRVFDSLREDTITRKILWAEDVGQATEDHPLYKDVALDASSSKGIVSGKNGVVKYIAAFDKSAFPDGKCYSVSLPGDGGKMYLMSCQGEIEAYSVYGQAVDAVCATSQPSEAVKDSLRALYKTIGDVAERFHLSESVKSRFDGYLKSKEPRRQEQPPKRVVRREGRAEGDYYISQYFRDQLTRENEDEIERNYSIADYLRRGKQEVDNWKDMSIPNWLLIDTYRNDNDRGHDDTIGRLSRRQSPWEED